MEITIEKGNICSDIVPPFHCHTMVVMLWFTFCKCHHFKSEFNRKNKLKLNEILSECK